jgi:hypothetical protein
MIEPIAEWPIAAFKIAAIVQSNDRCRNPQSPNKSPRGNWQSAMDAITAPL